MRPSDDQAQYKEPPMTETRTEAPHTAAAELVGDGDIARLREGLTDADQRIRQFVQAQPLMALLGAVVAGYVAARIFRRL